MRFKTMIIPMLASLLLLPFLTGLKAGESQKTNSSAALSVAGAKINRPELCELLIKSPYEKAVNIVIMGDGFTAADMNNGTYRREVAKFTDNFLSVPPFLQYQNFINVYMVKSVSRDSGADDAPGKDTKDTVFNATYGASGIQRLLVVQDYEAVRKWTGYATDDPHAVVILVNDSRHGGSGGYYSVASTGTHAFAVVMHELGHSLGGLADEYVDEGIAHNYNISGAESAKNVSTTGNLKTIKWSYFIGLDGYSYVGAYEGGYYRSKGVWRPIDNCLMKSLSYGYCPICREQIAMKISDIAGIPFQFDEFRERDPVMSESNELKVTQAVNYNGKSISPYTLEDFSGTRDDSVQDSVENKSWDDTEDYDTDSESDTASYSEIYDYYEGSFYHLDGNQWEERLNDGTVNKFNEYDRDDDYIYITDSGRNVTLAIGIDHLDCYKWNGKKWELIFQAKLRE